MDKNTSSESEFSQNKHQRKIDPYKNGLKPDFSPDNNDRAEVGPTPLAFAEWQAAGIECPNLPVMRQLRYDRLVAQINSRDLDAVLLFDPLSIRYATDCPDMQLWNTHNPFRACMVTAGGHMILWSYAGGAHTIQHNPLVHEIRASLRFFYFLSGERVEEKANQFADEMIETMKQHCNAGKKIAIDKIPHIGYQALKDKGFIISDGEEVMEQTRMIKNAEEIKAMRCAVHACEQSIPAMRAMAVPGVTENDVWAELHRENIRRGGEWIETRLLSSGPRTNPWMQECGPRVIGNNEILGFDTDLIGVYGICVDMSRTWFIGDGMPTQRQKDMFKLARDHIEYNASIVKPGMGFRELSEKIRQMPAQYAQQRYSCPFHGVGLCDEYPHISYLQDYDKEGVEGVLEAGMTLCVESYIGEVGGADGIKLENQILITDTGMEQLTQYPYDEKLNS